jgi:UrcA family protein
MLKQLFIASFAIASISSIAATSAQAQETQSVKVSVAGVDTRSPEGARIMLQRIQAAAGTICGPAPSKGMDRLTQYDPCVRTVTQATVNGLHNPVLTAELNGGKHPAQLASAK